MERIQVDKKIKKKKYKVYFLNLRKKYKNIFQEKELYEFKDIEYYFNQFVYHARKYKRLQFKILVHPVDYNNYRILFKTLPNNVIIKVNPLV